MKSFKKIMALVIALAMVLSVNAFATGDVENPEPITGDTPQATGDLTVDEKVTVSGFEEGDTVTAYQFITWVDGTGWVLANGITGITVDEIADGLTVAELATLATQTDKMTAVTGTTSGTTWEYTCGTKEKAGSYLILVADSKAEHIYNPAVVSADFDGTNSSAVDLTADAAMIKKQGVTVEKEADDAPDDYDVQVGDIVPFTVTVTVPIYNNNWTDPYFAVSDELSAGLTIETEPTIDGLTRGTEYNLISGGTQGSTGFTIKFSDAYLKQNASKVIEIKYSAKVGEAVKDNAQVHEETNKVTLEFSNNPSNSSDHKTVDDETHHYTFAIDATRLGQGSEKTNELLKVGVEPDGTPITTIKEGATLPTGVSPLIGAEFTLTGTGANNTGTVTLTATSDENGQIFFNNLEAGTYTLTETKAPNGYIKDNSTHTVVITAEYNDDTTLKSYTITIDGTATSTYTATTNSEEVTTYTVPAEGNDTFPINNKKGQELPSTGGTGTVLIYTFGAILVLAAGILLVTKRRAA